MVAIKGRAKSRFDFVAYTVAASICSSIDSICACDIACVVVWSWRRFDLPRVEVCEYDA